MQVKIDARVFFDYNKENCPGERKVRNGYARFTDYRRKVVDNCAQVIVGKEEAIDLLLTAFICSGHVTAGRPARYG